MGTRPTGRSSFGQRSDQHTRGVRTVALGGADKPGQRVRWQMTAPVPAGLPSSEPR